MSDPRERSLKDKVRAISKAQGRPFNIIWRSLVLERFLARLSASNFRERFIFKGGMLLSQYVSLGRETADLDFLLKGLSAEQALISEVITEICRIDLEDGFQFSIARIGIINHLLTKYPGYELSLDAACGQSATKVSIDIGVGGWADTTVKEIALISSAKGPIFEAETSLMVYPVEMIFAEKFQTACFRGAKNSRMKDYHDLFILSKAGDMFNTDRLNTCIAQVFMDRETQLSLIPEFEGEELENLQAMWERHRSALTRDVQEGLPQSIKTIISSLNSWVSTRVSSLKQ